MRLNEAGRNLLKEAHSESACAPGRCIVVGERETREQGRGIGMTDLLVLVGRQAAVGVQLGGERRGDTGGCIRVVAAKQDMSRGRKCQEAREPGWSGESCVEVKRLHVRRQSLNRAVRINACISLANRAAAYGRKPPACERITLIDRKRVMWPAVTRSTAVRVESKG